MQKEIIAERYSDGQFSADVDFAEEVITTKVGNQTVIIPNDEAGAFVRFLQGVTAEAGL